MKRRASLKPTRFIAHERAILEHWLEDDSVYVHLEDGQPRGGASGPGAAFAPADSRASAAFPLPPTPPR